MAASASRASARDHSYSLTHVLGMVGLRHLAYGVAGPHYGFGDWPRELLMSTSRTFAPMLPCSDSSTSTGCYCFDCAAKPGCSSRRTRDRPTKQSTGRRFLVRKLRAEFLVSASDIEFLEAAENYVNLHVRGRVSRCARR